MAGVRDKPGATMRLPLARPPLPAIDRAMTTPRTDGPVPRRNKVQSVETGLSVLAELARLGGAASLSGLAAATGLAAPKVHRYLSSLVAGGFVTQDGTGAYRLGLASLMIGLAALRANDPVRVAGERLPALRDAVDATCFVAVPANAGATVLLVAEAPGAVVVNVRLGSTLPGQSATALALQAFDPAHDGGAGTAAIRRAGCASVVDRVLVGVSAVSAPVRNHLGLPVAAITALGPTGTIDVASDGQPARAVVRAALAASRLLGLSDAP